MSRWKLLVGGLLLVGLGFVVLNVLLALRPAPAPLYPSPVWAAPAERNGWPLLAEAAHLRVDTKVNWEQHPFPSVDAVHDAVILDRLAQNAPALQKLDEALARPELAVTPADFDRMVGGDVFPEWAAIRELARLKSQRAFGRAAAGDAAGAMRDAEDVCHLGQRLQLAGNNLIGYLVAVAVEAIGQRAVQTLTGPKPAGNSLKALDPTVSWPVPKLSPEQRRQLQLAIAASADETMVLPALRAALSGELVCQRRMLRESPDSPLRHAPWLRALPWLYDPTDMQRLAESTVTQVLREAAKPAWERKVPDERATPRGWLLYNPIGRSLTRMLTPTYGKVADKTDTVRFNRRATATTLALRLYADDRGRLPATLDELVSAKLLPAVPADPFDGKPIRYAPRQGRIYSVYTNRRDDGGERNEKGGKDDQAVWLPFVVSAADQRAARDGGS